MNISVQVFVYIPVSSVLSFSHSNWYFLLNLHCQNNSWCWVYFHILLCQLYIFGVVYVQIFCPFICWIIYFLVVVWFLIVNIWIFAIITASIQVFLYYLHLTFSMLFSFISLGKSNYLSRSVSLPGNLGGDWKG